MHWYQVLVIIFTIIGVQGGIVFWFFTKLDSDIKATSQRASDDIKATSQRASEDIQTFVKRLDSQILRIDRLYQMFVDLLKKKN